jgi:hypothetical protein
MAPVAIELIVSNGAILEVNATTQFLHIDQDRPVTARIDPDVSKSRRNVDTIWS